MHAFSDIGPVVVTGAAGFIGGHVCRHLRSDPACHVVATTRDGRNGSIPLDLLDPASLSTALAGVGAVVHCAVGDRAVTVDGTRALLAAAAAAGVSRFVHISSVAVYGRAMGSVDEATPMVSATEHGYAGWKAAAEKACLGSPGMEVVRLRPTIVYGPGSALWVARLARRIQSGRWGTFGPAGEGTCNLVYVSDVVTAVERALVAPAVAGHAFNINGAQLMTWNEWFTRMGTGLGLPLRAVSPMALKARIVAALPMKAAARLSPGLAADWLLGAPALSELALFSLKASYPADAATGALGWAPSVGVDQGLADSIAWLRTGQPVA